MTKIKTLLILFSTFYILFSISAASAASILPSGLVPCGRCEQFKTDTDSEGHSVTTCVKPSVGATSDQANPCTVCDFFVLLKNIINLILLIFASLATLAVIYIAFLFMFSGGSPAKITDAKGKLLLVVIGIFWVLGSWLVLNTILNLVIDKSVFPWPWNQVNCTVSKPTIPYSASKVSGGIGTGNSDDSIFGGGSSGGGGARRGWEGLTLSEQEARKQLQQAGITINKNSCPMGTSYQNVSGGCTSLNGVKTSTIEKAIQLKNECNCAIEITGGTELGHAQGETSHASGNKLDFGLNSTLNQYIQSNFTPIGVRSDGAIQYRAPDGTLYAREGDHWDVTVISL